jgi:hypothetical protein
VRRRENETKVYNVPKFGTLEKILLGREVRRPSDRSLEMVKHVHNENPTDSRNSKGTLSNAASSMEVIGLLIINLKMFEGKRLVWS